MPIMFDDIKFDPLTCKPYFILYDEQFETIFREPIKSFENMVLQNDPNYELRKECASKLVTVGLHDQSDFDWRFLNFVKALLSVGDGKVYFRNQDEKWAWLANYVWEHHINYWIVFLYVVHEYGRTNTVFNPSNHKLNSKRQEFKEKESMNPNLVKIKNIIRCLLNCSQN